MHGKVLSSSSPQADQFSRAVDLSTPLSYCDRVQIRPPGDKLFALAPHVDGGGSERWEDKAYNHVYRKIFQGKWQEYNPWDLTGRLDANMNMYNGELGRGTITQWRGVEQ